MAILLLLGLARWDNDRRYRCGSIDWETYIDWTKYPQTWWIFARFKLTKRWWSIRRKCYKNPLGIAKEFVCGILTGHEASLTEYGYGGGSYIDRNCRWCDHVIKEPLETSKWGKEYLPALIESLEEIGAFEVFDKAGE
jgi:hypothetical protein